MRRIALVLLLASGAALAEGHGVTVVNHSSEAIRRIQIAPAGATSPGENRLRSQLPPNAEARITYSTGCRADVRVGFEGGRTEDFPGIDACTDPRLTTGGGVQSSATIGPERPAPTRSASGHGTPAKAMAPVIAPVVVPPWTGRSITKRFGGMD